MADVKAKPGESATSIGLVGKTKNVSICPPPKCDKEPVLEGVEGSDHGASRRLGRVCAAGPSRLTLKRTAAAPGIQ